MEWLKKLVRGGDESTNAHHTLTQLEHLFPGVYYRLKAVPEITFTHIGEDVRQLLGYKSKELDNASTMATLRQLHPEYQTILETKKNLCSHSREPNKLEYHLYTKSGELKLVRDHFIGEYKGGNLVAIHGYFKEIKRARIKREVVSQLEAYRAAIDVNIISSITDTNRRIIYVNENFKKYTKYSEEEILGRTHDFLNSGYHPASFIDNMWETVSRGKMWEGEIHTRAKDGSFNWVNTVIIPTFDRGQKITSYLFLSVLSNERKHAEQQREKYISLLEQMAHTVAHDLRGPVCSILGLVNIFGSIECQNKNVRQATDYLIYAAKQLDKISRDLSARIYQADREMKGEVFDQPLGTKSNANTTDVRINSE